MSETQPEVMKDVPWWRGAVIYQIYPRSFADSNDDGIGDLPGIISKLDYIADLGVDGIWISPFFTSPMKDFGYDVADYCDVDPIFGMLDDFDRLIETAHALGLRVVIDQVYAHTSDLHDWFSESRASRDGTKSDWYVWADAKPDGTPPNNWQAVFGGPSWTWDARRGQYYMHNFLPSQPQLNLHNDDVQEALLDVARFWLERGVDGFRLDAINFAMHDPALTYNPPRDLKGRKPTRPFDFQDHIHNQSQPGIPLFLERVRQVTDEFGVRLTVAEVPGANALEEMKAFTADEKRLNSAYNFDFLYASTLTPRRVKRSLDGWTGAPGEGWPSWEFSNHDAPRYVSRWHDGSNPVAFAKMANALLLCLRGNPIIYQGEELGLEQAEIAFEDLQDPEAIANWPMTLGRDGARTPIPWAAQDEFAGFSGVQPWLPVWDAHAEMAVDRQLADEDSVFAFVRAFLAARKQSPALQIGDVEFVDAPEPLPAFWRTLGEERVFCAFNLGGAPVEWEPPLDDTATAIVPTEWARSASGIAPPFGVLVAKG
ncbi:MAG: alpha-glucosidase [Pseudomonadota bacterium]